jgi:MFS family permease
VRSPRVPPTEGAGRARSALVVAVLALCGTVVSLQQTLVLPLLPDFPRVLNTGVENASWMVTATLLTGAVSIPTVSRLADMYGKKRMMAFSLAVMVTGSVLGALTEALPFMIAARALQGVGMALIPIGIAIMRDELPRHRVPLGVALMSATLAIGAGVGLPLSGLIAAHMDWHAIFWVTGVAGAVMLVAILLVVDESPVRTRGSFDFRGAIVLSMALAAVLLTLSKGGQWGWTSALTVGLAIAGAVLIAVWIPLELRVRNPLVDIRVSARPAVLLVNIVAILSGFAMFANMLITTQQLQLPPATGFGLGLDTLQTGLWMAPSALVFGVMAPVSAAVIRRFSAQTALLSASLLLTASYAARVFLDENLAQVVVGSMLVSVGASIAFAAMPTLIMQAVPVTETASANGINTLMRSIGTSTSSAVIAAAATAGAVTVGGELFPSAGVITALFWVAALLSLVAAGLTVPMFGIREYSDDATDAGRTPHGAVVRGRVLSRSGKPIRSAVVTLLTLGGDQVDWSQVDSAGEFSIAIPCPGRYVVVAAADGWTPTSRLDDLDAATTLAPLVLTERLTLSGTVRNGTSSAVADAVVVLTRHSGECAGTTRTLFDGRYELPIPTNGRYVLTVVTPDGVTTARSVHIWGTAHTIDVDLTTDDNGHPPNVKPQETYR